MKKLLYQIMLILLAVILCACTDTPVEESDTPLSEEESSVAEGTSDDLTSDDFASDDFASDDLTSDDLTSDDPTSDDPTSDDPTSDDRTSDVDTEDDQSSEPLHSDLYLPQCSAQQMFDYFEEVALRMEYNIGTGDVSLVQKWNQPLRYRIYGDYTQQDISILMELFDQLNEIEGFPGIYAADEGMENLSISFLNQDDFDLSFSEILHGEYAFGATQYWYYNDNNEIYTANVGYRTDIDQETRNSILIEEIINMLGLSDTVLREDSIVYQYSDANTALSDVDWVILKLLYNSRIKSGMDINSCREIVGELYY